MIIKKYVFSVVVFLVLICALDVQSTRRSASRNRSSNKTRSTSSIYAHNKYGHINPNLIAVIAYNKQQKNT